MGDKRRFGIVLAIAAAGAALLWLSLRHGVGGEPPIVGRAPGLELRFYKNNGTFLLKPGDTLQLGDSISASYRNLGNESLWAFVFAYDSQGHLYWLEPHHQIGTRREDLSVGLAPADRERRVGSEARLEAVPPGSFTVFGLVTPGIMTAERIERLGADEHDRASLLARFPDAVVVELPLMVPPQAP